MKLKKIFKLTVFALMILLDFHAISAEPTDLISEENFKLELVSAFSK